MGTSKSTRERFDYTGGVSIFSGRPDPIWPVSQDAAARLLALWDALESYSGSPPAAPVLGYRGCFLRESPALREWVAYRGLVTLKSIKDSEARQDKNREFETLLLSSAPDDTIPTQVLESELKR